MKKTWTKDEVKAMLLSNDRWLIRGLISIYKHQSYDEVKDRSTHLLNGVGFNAFDADFLTGMAEKVNDGQYLTNRQLAVIRKAMVKYSGQLAKIANHQA